MTPTEENQTQTEQASVQHSPEIEIAKSPMREWGLTAIIMTFAVLFVGGRWIVASVTSDSSGMCLVILGCFGFALRKNYSDISFINEEHRNAEQHIRQLVKTSNIKQILADRSGGLFTQHVSNLYEMSKRTDDVSQGNLVALLHERLDARIKSTEMFSGLLVTFGLIGTILGLIVAIQGLDGIAGSGDSQPANIMTNLSKTIGGMGTAFYTTLMGSVLGGVFLKVLFSIVEKHARLLVTRIAELSEIFIVPSLRTSAERARKS